MDRIANMPQESYATPPAAPPIGGRGVRAWLFSLWQKDTTFFWRLSKDSLSKDRVPSDLYIEASLSAARPLYRSLPYSQSQGQPHVMASLGQSGQIVVKLILSMCKMSIHICIKLFTPCEKLFTTQKSIDPLSHKH